MTTCLRALLRLPRPLLKKNKHPCKRTKGTQGWRTKTKCVAIGLAQRDGQCRAFASPTATAQDREALVSVHVRPGAEIYADAYHAYPSFASDYPLHRVTHSRGEYVREGVHINPEGLGISADILVQPYDLQAA